MSWGGSKSAAIYGTCKQPDRQQRWFRDYFTAKLPGSSLHPDSQLPGNSGKSPAASDRAATTVRIPLRSAKHHFGATRARGTRPYNEDNYQAGIISVPPFCQQPSPRVDTTELAVREQSEEPSVFYFAVFDGHGGDAASVFLKDYLHQYIEATAALFGAEDQERRKELQNELVDAWKEVGGYFRRFRPDFGLKGAGRKGDGGIAATLSYAFLKADIDFIKNTRPWFLKEEEMPEQLKMGDQGEINPFSGGSTASVVLLSSSSAEPYWHPHQTSTLITAHLGDTRALLCRVSDGLAVPLTTIHHPSSVSESARLRRYAAAFVSDAFGEERFGIFANTRSVGDVTQKRLGVTAEPELTMRELGAGEYAFLVLVSDGVSTVIGDQEICDLVKECKTPEEASRELVAFVDEVGDAGDNATALVVRLGGWEHRSEGGEGSLGTAGMREWRRMDAIERGSRSRRM